MYSNTRFPYLVTPPRRKASFMHPLLNNCASARDVTIYFADDERSRDLYNMEFCFKVFYIVAGQTSLHQVQREFALGHVLILQVFAQ